MNEELEDKVVTITKCPGCKERHDFITITAIDKTFTMGGRTITHFFECPVANVTIFVARPMTQKGN